MIENLGELFPEFARRLADCSPDDIGVPLEPEKIDALERKLGLTLPQSYKEFLGQCCSIQLLNGSFFMRSSYPAFQIFPSFASLSSQQVEAVNASGGHWPPPAHGMLCFADYSWKAVGDQVLFKVEDGLIDGEYPIYYYSHADYPPSVHKVADSFKEWIECHCIQDMSGDA